MRATAGQLNWMATQTMPDLSYDALKQNISRQHPTVDRSMRADKAVHHAKQVQQDTCFPELRPCSKWIMNVSCVAPEYCVLKSQGHAIFLTGREHNTVTKNRIVCHSMFIARNHVNVNSLLLIRMCESHSQGTYHGSFLTI